VKSPLAPGAKFADRDAQGELGPDASGGLLWHRQPGQERNRKQKRFQGP